ncbi:hypothetical protein H310_13290 [Aphanomyces invadans]|uniref:Uncharacterized protein n=1 Tax=Aphanomyces invadans TaxID=157072 RepID=A0A024TGG6_9STRA|nr:hypothetical protein H310_13290 [Aphanomyces invadans]ETV92402.1 hypothetical protein H310_13290 [Aphanomyces invadans]|eukprot:XP_008878953.1 hypothetical protein H310_13290 [Aphanomyces invadans]
MDSTATPRAWLLGLYVPLAVLGVYRLWLNWIRDRAAVALYTCIIVGSVGEVSSALLLPPSPQSSAAAMLGDNCFVAAYLLIMYNWSVIAKRMDELRTTTAPVAVIAYVTMSGLAYTSDTVVFGAAMAFSASGSINSSIASHATDSLCWLRSATQAGVAAVSVLAVGLFPYYGHRMRNVLQRVGEDSPRRMRNIASIAVTAAVYFACQGADHIRSTLHVASTCKGDTTRAISSPLQNLDVIKPLCVLMLLVFLPRKPAPSKAGYVRLGSTNA